LPEVAKAVCKVSANSLILFISKSIRSSTSTYSDLNACVFVSTAFGTSVVNFEISLSKTLSSPKTDCSVARCSSESFADKSPNNTPLAGICVEVFCDVKGPLEPADVSCTHFLDVSSNVTPSSFAF